MLIADKYIGKQVLSTTVFAVVILSAIFLLGNLFKEVRPLFVGQRPSFILIAQFIFKVLPFSLIFTIPFSFLAAIMLVFGRLSSDQEITSLRMAGWSLWRISASVFTLAIALSFTCFWLNSDVAPKAKRDLKELLLNAIKKNPSRFFDPGVVQTQLKNKRVYVEQRDGNILSGVHIHNISSNGKDIESYIYAEKAKIQVQQKLGQIALKLFNTTIELKNKHHNRTPITVEEINYLLFSFNTKKNRPYKASAMSNTEIREKLNLLSTDQSSRQTLKMHKELKFRYAYGFACVAFAFIGIPLGINSRRKDSSTGFVWALSIGIIYYLFYIIAGKTNISHGYLSNLIYWLPNLLAVLLGFWLFRRTLRR